MKITGKNLGYPDQLQNLTQAMHKAYIEQQMLYNNNQTKEHTEVLPSATNDYDDVTEKDASQLPAVYIKVEESKNQKELTNKGSNYTTSQKDLNADLMAQNIYRSEEFFDSVPRLNLKNLQPWGDNSQGGPESHAMMNNLQITDSERVLPFNNQSNRTSKIDVQEEQGEERKLNTNMSTEMIEQLKQIQSKTEVLD